MAPGRTPGQHIDARTARYGPTWTTESVALGRGEHHTQRPTTPVAAEVDLGGQPAPGPAERLERVMADPLLRSTRPACLRAPAACWWARTLLLSTLMLHSSSPTASDLVWAWASSRSQVPSWRQ